MNVQRENILVHHMQLVLMQLMVICAYVMMASLIRRRNINLHLDVVVVMVRFCKHFVSIRKIIQ